MTMLQHAFSLTPFHLNLLVDRRRTPDAEKRLRSGDLIRLAGGWYIDSVLGATDRNHRISREELLEAAAV